MAKRSISQQIPPYSPLKPQKSAVLPARFSAITSGYVSGKIQRGQRIDRPALPQQNTPG